MKAEEVLNIIQEQRSDDEKAASFVKGIISDLSKITRVSDADRLRMLRDIKGTIDELIRFYK